MNTSLDPWDQLHPMISLQNTDPNGFGNLNLRIKESHLRVVFLIAQGNKKTNCPSNNLSFSIRLLNQAFQEASHEVF